MNVPRRILDGGAGDLERMVLESAVSDAPTPEFKARMTKQIGVLASVATMTTATAVSGQTLGALAWVKLLGAGAVMGFATAGVAYAVHEAPKQPERAAPVRVAEAPSSRSVDPEPEARASAGLAPAPTASPATTKPGAQPARAEGRPLAAPEATLPSRASMASPDSALSEELRSIEKTRSALAAGDTTAALSSLDRYEAAPGPKLFAVEAMVLRIEALARSGNDAQARSLARRFLSEHPESPYVERVRSLVRDP